MGMRSIQYNTLSLQKESGLLETFMLLIQSVFTIRLNQISMYPVNHFFFCLNKKKTKKKRLVKMTCLHPV